MKLVTWNINSIRKRLPLLKKFIASYQPDVIALQETKVQDSEFPKEACINLGYPHLEFVGEKSYNGVAILSKIPFSSPKFTLKLYNKDTRHISVSFHDIELHNFYVPAGGDIPDQSLNPKFQHKLEYIDLMNLFFLKNRAINDKIILLGDLNVAPLENDVWSSKQLSNVVSHTAIERSKILNNIKEFNWIDIPRSFVTDSQKLYSWWSYRNRCWKTSNRGRRLDHIWMSNNISYRVKSCTTFSQVRDWSEPSDHVPIMVEII